MEGAPSTSSYASSSFNLDIDSIFCFFKSQAVLVDTMYYKNVLHIFHGMFITWGSKTIVKHKILLSNLIYAFTSLQMPVPGQHNGW